MQTFGVPYTDAEIAYAQANLRAQATKIEKSLKNDPDFVKSYEKVKKSRSKR
jgi:cytochrome c oxidase cbb3-type subunit I/II